MISHIEAQQLSLADIDFQHFRSTTVLFTLQVTNTQPSGFDATIEIGLDVQLASGSQPFPPTVMNYMSNPFSVPPGGRTFTNLNLGAGGDITGHLDFDAQAKDYLKDNALGTGILPAGTYIFHFTLHAPNNCPDSTRDIRFVLENPTRVELRSPRDGETTNEFPLFEFYQESDRAVLTVAEKNPDQSNEDAITRKPPMIEQELVGGQNSFLYSGGRPLEIGKTYVWQVVSKVRGTAGKDNDVASSIWSLTVSNSPNGGASANDAILNQLEEIFGQRYPDIFQQIRTRGFSLTGSNRFNGGTISQSELLNLIHQLRELGDSAELSFE
ncbi:MAG: hypothetical protein HY033_10620 [Ignavibacteriae bacterium]|nr:hypothetical protein [Ignavibacteriota bacterium]